MKSIQERIETPMKKTKIEEIKVKNGSCRKAKYQVEQACAAMKGNSVSDLNDGYSKPLPQRNCTSVSPCLLDSPVGELSNEVH